VRTAVLIVRRTIAGCRGTDDSGARAFIAGSLHQRFTAPELIVNRGASAKANMIRAAASRLAGFAARASTKHGRLPFPVSATLHKSDSRSQTAQQRVLERRQHQKRAEEVLRTQIDATFVVLEDDNTLLGDDDSPGTRKAAMAAALIQTYGAQAFTAVNGKGELQHHVRSHVCEGGVFVQIVDSNQDLSSRHRRRVVLGKYQPKRTTCARWQGTCC
jgi:hypothetical protein